MSEITGSVGSRSHDFRVANVNKEITSAKQRGTQMQKNTPWNACMPRALFVCIYATTVATEMKRSGIEVPRCSAGISVPEMPTSAQLMLPTLQTRHRRVCLTLRPQCSKRKSKSSPWSNSKAFPPLRWGAFLIIPRSHADPLALEARRPPLKMCHRHIFLTLRQFSKKVDRGRGS